MKSKSVKYAEAVGRNLESFLRRSKEGIGNCQVGVLAKLSLEELKTRVGIRSNDDHFNSELSKVLKEAKEKVEHAKQAEEKKKKEEKVEKQPNTIKATAKKVEKPEKQLKPKKQKS